MKHRFTPGSAIALLALFIALGGSALAAKHYVITSASQIKPSVLKGLRGKQGPRGAQGPAGPSSLSALAIVFGPKVSIAPGKVGSSIATCPAGSRAVSGGGNAITGEANGLAASEMVGDHSGWFTVVGNTSVITGETQAVAYCSAAGVAVASNVDRTPSGKALREIEGLERRVEASLSR